MVGRVIAGTMESRSAWKFSLLRRMAAAGKAAAGRQKQAQDFSSFLRNAGTQEPRRQATSFSSFIRQGIPMHTPCKRIASLYLAAQLLADLTASMPDQSKAAP